MTFGYLSFGLTDPDWFAFYASPTRAWEFAVGSIAYLATAKFIAYVSDPMRSALFWVGLVGIAASLILINEYVPFPGWIALFPVLATALTMMAGGRRVRAERILANPAMVSIGDVSYSWYLWHWPLISFVILLFPDFHLGPAVVAILSLLLAYLSLRFVENPLRFSPSFDTKRVVIFTMASVSSISVVAAILLLGANRSWGNEGIRDMANQVSAVHLWQSTDCNSSTPLGSRDTNCTWNSEAGGQSIFLVGDSMAGALSEGVLIAAEKAKKSVVVGTMGACPFITTEIELNNGDSDKCNAFVLESLKWLTKQPPSDVIMSSSLGYTVLDFVSFIDPKTGQKVSAKAAKEELYLEGLRSVIMQLNEVGHNVTVVLPPPGFPKTVMAVDAWYPSQCPTILALRNIRDCGEKRAESDVRTETGRLFNEVSATVRNSGGRIFDPRGSICQEGVCATNRDNEWFYLDGSHISVGMSERLAPDLFSFID
jgi:hypothetical protein